jgi:hypothetical protein
MMFWPRWLGLKDRNLQRVLSISYTAASRHDHADEERIHHELDDIVNRAQHLPHAGPDLEPPVDATRSFAGDKHPSFGRTSLSLGVGLMLLALFLLLSAYLDIRSELVMLVLSLVVTFAALGYLAALARVVPAKLKVPERVSISRCLQLATRLATRTRDLTADPAETRDHVK